jgi:5-methylthioadenosine/S-adenosylhomocysteine deaminase
MSRLDDLYFSGIDDEVAADPAPLPPPLGVVAGTEYALRGCVITPDQRIDDGFVHVVGDRIASVGSAAPPAGVVVVDTGGVILPGLIDLHGHPEFNVFAPWEPPRLYERRRTWRGSREYKAVVRDPWNNLTRVDAGEPLLLPLMTRYAEARALVAGVTALQGASAKYPDPTESLVRNVDRRLFGAQRARSAIDFDREAPDVRARRVQQIRDGEVTAYYVHLAEGIAADAASRAEFADLKGAGLLTGATVIIHGSALTEADLGEVRDAGAKLVWSPQSNLRLYGSTTLAARVLALGIPMAIGADWQPSGSPSLLAELKVARRALAVQGLAVDPRELVFAVTSRAAAIADLDAHIGSLATGRMADILVLERHHDDPWLNVVEASPSWVRLVTIGGDLVYGDEALINRVADTSTMEEVWAWGRPMVLDTSYSVRASGSPAPRLAQLRAALLARDLRVGPIFA